MQLSTICQCAPAVASPVEEVKKKLKEKENRPILEQIIMECFFYKEFSGKFELF